MSKKYIILHSDYENYPLFTVMDSPVIYNKEKHTLPRIYYIESEH